jgi:ketosteroid isomerase-like protein
VRRQPLRLKPFAAPFKETEMDISQNKQLVKQAYEHYKNKKIDGILAMVDDDIEWLGYESDLIPFAGNYHGKDEVAQFFSTLAQNQDVLRFDPQNFIAEGDKVVVTGAASYHVKATGLDYESPWVHIFTVRDGKIIRFQQFNHTAAAEAAYRPAQATGMGSQRPLHH